MCDRVQGWGYNAIAVLGFGRCDRVLGGVEVRSLFWGCGRVRSLF
ncbi:hypothetical protein [Dolichospermum circinale]|nr:hypothetical protein [Dolichospermum circinale]MDB9476218.1 hypothetical protein [Dolichospermum circinale CS-537/11]MDB9479358.1 hypothetical protein [Dolichospermum circinale CS-537/03]